MPTYPYGDQWRTFVTHNYKQKTKVTRTRREGKAWEAEMLRNMQQSEQERKQYVTLKYVFEKYRDEVTPKKRGKRWEHIRIEAFLKSTMPLNEPVHTIEPNHIGKWRDERLFTVSAGTVLRDFALLSAIFEHARKEWKLIEVNPIRDVKKPREPDHRDIIISRSQIKRLLKEMGYKPNHPVRTVSQAVACCFIVALRTGMRAGELTSLTWKNVKDDYCILPVTKTVPRNVPLSTKAIRAINTMKGYDSILVFGLKPSTLDAMFRKYRDRAGISNVHFHDARHTAATWMARKVDVLTLCKIFGWKNTKMALTYYNPKASDIAKLLG